MSFALSRKTALLLLLLIVFSVYSAAAQSTEEPPAPTEEITPEVTQQALDVELLVPEVLSERPHDPNAFTQGFELVDGSTMRVPGVTANQRSAKSIP
jgi:glutamine cyclotransferase